ncbi:MULTISPECIES: NAD(P)/FAD-dependent oxidoreductase [Micromonospora]|uniref:FAD/NAD(P)-binding oxidoreductase n=1 Tax=Micromonospora sicca TaxID=2202420 RepID=A0A317DM89_9ACTN|nr:MULTISPECIES: NAD(P)/FAD-dependent oxidoreductase [unclassified Micromonospora]MBM0226741.1 FAD-dependent oxidoreductase [Micromonospora sp. ATA51]PWR15330.1 FAD/NAD(P)-binding oxidoreductase [Micromonospora sp. 4G51]
MNQDAFDVAVVGAGPAGLAAALAAAESGVTVALIDAGVGPGGQYWRSPAPGAGTFKPNTLHHSWRRFTDTTTRLSALASAGRAVRFAGHHVWSIAQADDRWSLHCNVGAEPRQRDAQPPVTIHARRLVLATGAYDRQLPFPGWDLPGVMTAGGVQSLLKGHLVVAGETVVVAGTGPFLLPVAVGLARYGARVAAVIEANTPLAFTRSPRAVFGAINKLGEAATYGVALLRHRVAVRHRHAVIRAFGNDRLEGVVVARLDRDGRPLADTERSVACDLLAVGWGFTPQLELHLQLGCATRMDVDSSLIVDVDDNQQTTVEGVWAAGESTGVGGADLASVEGMIAGYAVARSLDATPVRNDVPLRRRRGALREFATVMHRVYSIPDALLDDVDDETLVCRCEEVTAGSLRRAVDELGATDPRTVKLLVRPGMGWCQGRVCGFATVCLTARHTGRAAVDSDMRAFADRPIATPTPLGSLARLADD